MWSYYLAVFAGTVILSLALTRFIRDDANRRGWLDAPSNGRHRHSVPVPRLGGVAIFLTFAFATAIALAASKLLEIRPALSGQTALGIVFPAMLIFTLGLYDDRFSLGPYWKLGVESIAAVWLYWGGFGIHWLAFYPGKHALQISLGLPLTIFWVLLITNAFNLIDGLDGLSAGLALFSTLIIFAVSLCRHTPLISLFSIVLAGTMLGFLRYNFHPASIFLGDSGSLFIGFLLSALALAGSQKSTTAVAIAIPVVAFGLPVLDVCISVIRRYLSGKPIFLADEDHLHHKLLKRGLSHRDAVLVLYAVAVAFSFLSLTLLHGDMRVSFVLLPIALGVWVGVRQLKYVELYELAGAARQIWRQKRVIANNLQVRRAIESLPNATLDFAETCRILQVSLESAGFCGVSLSFPEIDWIDPASLFPLRPDGKDRWSHCWLDRDLSAHQWELKLELTSPSGGKLANLYLLRERASDALLLDMNLLGDEFRDAVSDVVARALGRISAQAGVREKSEGSIAVRTAGASS